MSPGSFRSGRARSSIHFPFPGIVPKFVEAKELLPAWVDEKRMGCFKDMVRLGRSYRACPDDSDFHRIISLVTGKNFSISSRRFEN